jgi:hypothetical protein
LIYNFKFEKLKKQFPQCNSELNQFKQHWMTWSHKWQTNSVINDNIPCKLRFNLIPIEIGNRSIYQLENERCLLSTVFSLDPIYNFIITIEISGNVLGLGNIIWHFMMILIRYLVRYLLSWKCYLFEDEIQRHTATRLTLTYTL